MTEKPKDTSQPTLYEINRHHGERAHDRANEEIDKLNEAAIDSGHVALRTSVLVNGGAAVAVLAFIGSLVSQKQLAIAQINGVASSLMWFAFGVAAAVTAMGFTYFTNFCAAGALASHVKKWEHPYVSETPSAKVWRGLSVTFQICAILSGLISLALFVIGMVDVRNSIAQFTG